MPTKTSSRSFTSRLSRPSPSCSVHSSASAVSSFPSQVPYTSLKNPYDSALSFSTTSFLIDSRYAWSSSSTPGRRDSIALALILKKAESLSVKLFEQKQHVSGRYYKGLGRRVGTYSKSSERPIAFPSTTRSFEYTSLTSNPDAKLDELFLETLARLPSAVLRLARLNMSSP
jgi:hypothetical protein